MIGVNAQTSVADARYLKVVLDPIRACAHYRPKFGQGADHGPQNLPLLRRLALNLARLEPSKGSIKGQLRRAGWHDAFRVQLLSQFANPQMRLPCRGGITRTRRLSGGSRGGNAAP